MIAKLAMDLTNEVERLRARVDELLEANNRSQQEARDARAETKAQAIEHSKEIADMATRFRAANIERVAELTGTDIRALADRCQKAEAEVARLQASDKEWGRLHQQVIDERAALLTQIAGYTKPTHRHKKRSTEYVMLGIGKMQAERWFDLLIHNGVLEAKTSVDMREVAIYRSVDDGSYWVRPCDEFEDGRFETIEAGK